MSQELSDPLENLAAKTLAYNRSDESERDRKAWRKSQWGEVLNIAGRILDSSPENEVKQLRYGRSYIERLSKPLEISLYEATTSLIISRQTETSEDPLMVRTNVDITTRLNVMDPETGNYRAMFKIVQESATDHGRTRRKTRVYNFRIAIASDADIVEALAAAKRYEERYGQL